MINFKKLYMKLYDGNELCELQGILDPRDRGFQPDEDEKNYPTRVLTSRSYTYATFRSQIPHAHNQC